MLTETHMWRQPPSAVRRAKLDDLSHNRQASPSQPIHDAIWIPRHGIALRGIFGMHPVFYKVAVLTESAPHWTSETANFTLLP